MSDLLAGDPGPVPPGVEDVGTAQRVAAHDGGGLDMVTWLQYKTTGCQPPVGWTQTPVWSSPQLLYYSAWQRGGSLFWLNRVQWHNPEYSNNHNIANTAQTEAHLPPISVRDPGIRYRATVLTLVVAVIYGLLHCPHPQQGPHVSSGVLYCYTWGIQSVALYSYTLTGCVWIYCWCRPAPGLPQGWTVHCWRCPPCWCSHRNHLRTFMKNDALSTLLTHVTNTVVEGESDHGGQVEALDDISARSDHPLHLAQGQYARLLRLLGGLFWWVIRWPTWTWHPLASG